MNRLFRGILISSLIHGGLFGGALGLIAWGEAHTEYRVDIDMKSTPLLSVGTQATPVIETWIMAKKGKSPTPPTIKPTPEPDLAVAVVASRQPSWVGGMIGEDDYPIEMRKQKKEGRVVAELLINIEGKVKSVSIVQGSTPEFNTVVMAKLQDARFRPALDASGQPINCRVRLPIAFKLN